VFFARAGSHKSLAARAGVLAQVPLSTAVSEMLPTKKSRDRRSRRRYPIHLPVHFKVIERDRLISAGTGNVLNMSSNGIAFRADETFRLGMSLNLY
jgi:hypothetical protein